MGHNAFKYIDKFSKFPIKYTNMKIIHYNSLKINSLLSIIQLINDNAFQCDDKVSEFQM